MIIEQNTNYAYKLKYMENPTFDKVRDLAIKFMRELPKPLQDELYEALNRGIDILDSEPQMVTYLYAFGPMHQAKLNYAFKHLPEDFFEQPKINIIDYGCGQALGTMCYADYLRENGYSQKVKTITLIEPSEICLKRAALHASVFFPDAEIKTMNKNFDELEEIDIYCNEDIPTLHILSNVLDILDFDLKDFSDLIKRQLKSYNQFVCVGPCFNYSDKDERMDVLFSLMDGKRNYRESFDKYEFDPEKTWTAKILCFSKGELIGGLKDEIISTEVIEDDFGDAVEDEYGVLYSRDGNKLLKCKNKNITSYNVRQGTKTICDRAFLSVDKLEQVIIPRSVTKIEDQAFCDCKSLQKIDMPDSVTSIGYNAFGLCKSLQRINIPDSVSFLGPAAFHRCISLQQVVISNSLARIDYMTFCECNSIQQIVIPNSITVISDWAFSECKSLKQITISDSLSHLGTGVFAKCESLEQFVLPNSVQSIGDSAFEECKSLQQIIIPKGSSEKFKKMLEEKLWDKLVEQ